MAEFDVVAIISANITKYKQALDEASRGMQELESGNLNSIGKIGKGTSTLGKTMTKGLTVPIAGLGTISTKTFMDFEKQMNRVKAISGATGKDFEAMEKQAIDLGASSVFSATEVAQAQEELASQGFSVNEIMAAMPGLLDLAAVSGGDLAMSAQAVGSGMNQFAIEGKDAIRVADVYARAAADTNAETADMAEAMKYAGPVANSLGLNLEETAAAIGIMSDAGIKGSQAGTSLRTGLARMAKPTEAMEEKMKELGLSFFDSQGKIKPLDQIIGELQGSFKGLTKEQKLAATETLFGKNAMSGMLALVESSPGEFKKLEDSLVNSSGAAKTMADTMNSGLAGAFEELSGKLETAGIIIGEKLAPHIENLSNWIGSLIDKFNALSPEQQDQIVKWGLILAALGPVLWIFGKIIGLAQSLWGVFGLLGKALIFLTSPIGLVVAAIGLLVGGFIYLWNTSEDFRNFFINLWNGIKNFFVSTVPEFFNAAVKWIGAIPGKVSVWFTNIKTKITTAVTNAYNSVVEWFSGIARKIGEYITNAYNSVVEWGQNLWNKAKEIGNNFVTNVITPIIQLPGKIWKWISQAAQNVVTWGGDLARKGSEAATKLFNAVVDGIKGLPGRMLSIGGDLVSGLWKGITGSFDWIKNKIFGFGAGVLGAVKGAFGIASPSKKTKEDGIFLVEGLMVGIKKMEREPGKLFGNMISGLQNVKPIGINAGYSGTSHVEKQLSLKTDEINRKPADIILKFGNRAFKAMAGDINNLNGRTMQLEEIYGM